MNRPRIIFMGTPEFAVPSLERLVEAGFEVAAVITAPDRPAGRGLRLAESAVKQTARSKQLAILQPEKLKDPAFIDALIQLRADLQVVVAFRMLPEIVWSMPPLGTINLHASLLPQYRGAAPINWAIINGETETGVTTFRLQHQIDTGNILLQKKVAIGPEETAGELHDRLMNDGAGLLLETLIRLSAGTLGETPQPDLPQGSLHHAPKIYPETCRIGWDAPAGNIYNLVRGLSPYPAAFTMLEDRKIKILSCEKEVTAVPETPGALVTDHKTFLKFACRDGYISVKELQPEGRKKMAIGDFLRGWRP